MSRKVCNKKSHPDYLTSSARLYFLLNALPQEAPDVLTDLRKNVWASYREMFPKKLTDHHLAIACKLKYAGKEHWDIQWRKRKVEFLLDLENWGAGFNLDVEWVYQAALSTLHFWLIYEKANTGKAPPSLAWTLSHPLAAQGLYLPGSATINFQDSPIFSLSHEWDYKAAQQMMREAFKAKLSETLGLLIEFKKQRELIFGISGKRNPDHYKWLIRYQVKKESKNKIAHSLSSSTNQSHCPPSPQGTSSKISTVAEGMDSLAKLLKLPLRPPSFPGPGPSKK